MAQSVKPFTGGDVVIHYESTQYNMYSSTVTNAGTATVPQVAGYPVDDSGNLLLVAAFGNATGLLVHGPALNGVAATTSTDKYQVVRGDNVTINETRLPATDYAGTAIDGAAVTALKGAAGLAGFRWVTEPSKTETQTS